MFLSQFGGVASQYRLPFTVHFCRLSTKRSWKLKKRRFSRLLFGSTPKKPMRKVAFFFLLLACAFSNESLCQEENLDPELLAWYKQTLPFFQDIITGGQYADAPNSYLGSPFYGSGEVRNGQIWINGLGYDNVPLLYDVWQDDLVTVHPRFNQKTLIKAEKIEKFVLADGAVFLKYALNPDYGKHHHGFYQVVYEGEPKLLKKHYRNIDAVNETGLITKEFKVGQDYFFWYRDEFWKIGGKADAASALGLSKKEVNRHFTGKGIVFKKNLERYLLELLNIEENKGVNFKGFPTR